MYFSVSQPTIKQNVANFTRPTPPNAHTRARRPEKPEAVATLPTADWTAERSTTWSKRMEYLHGTIGTHGIHNSPKRLPANRQPPPVYNQFAAGGGRPRLESLPDPSQMVANRPSWRYRQQLATSASTHPSVSRNPFEFGNAHDGRFAHHRRGIRQDHEPSPSHFAAAPVPPAAAAPAEPEPTPPPSHRSLGASTVFCACGTEWQSAPESQRSLGGFSVIMEDEPSHTPDLAALRAPLNLGAHGAHGAPQSLASLSSLGARSVASSSHAALGAGAQACASANASTPPQRVSFQPPGAAGGGAVQLRNAQRAPPARASAALRRAF